MKYPYLKTVHEEMADGGFTMMAWEMVGFALKVFVFIAMGYLALWITGLAIADKLTKTMSPECISQITKI